MLNQSTFAALCITVLTISGDDGFCGCLRGSYTKYTDAQKRGIEIFIDFHKTHGN
jgi:hypothetical protein